MSFLSSIFRFIHRSYLGILNFFRILKLNLLYPGLSINPGCTVETNCLIKCIKGGRLIIRDCTISAGTQIVADATGTIEMEGVFVGRNCVITAKSKVVIKKGCLLAEMVVVRDQDHQQETDARDSFHVAPIEINDNVWIASKATVLKGVTIGSNAIIAASAVVTKNVPAAEVWGGIPAKFLKAVASSSSI